jgi:DinB family protein
VASYRFGGVAMATVTSERDMLDGLLGDVEQIRERARRLTGDLSAGQLGWGPPGDGWSVGQVLEHLLISDHSYVVRMRPLIESARARSTSPAPASWRPTLAGRFLIKSLAPTATRKLPAPSVYRPGPTARAGVVAEYLRSLDELAALMRGARGLDLGHLRMSSPVSKLIRLHVGDGFSIMVVHAQRHLGQIERVEASPGFPQG